jgi:hypothetical protein
MHILGYRPSAPTRSRRRRFWAMTVASCITVVVGWNLNSITHQVRLDILQWQCSTYLDTTSVSVFEFARREATIGYAQQCSRISGQFLRNSEWCRGRTPACWRDLESAIGVSNLNSPIQLDGTVFLGILRDPKGRKCLVVVEATSSEPEWPHGLGFRVSTLHSSWFSTPIPVQEFVSCEDPAALYDLHYAEGVMGGLTISACKVDPDDPSAFIGALSMGQETGTMHGRLGDDEHLTLWVEGVSSVVRDSSHVHR